MGTEVGYGYLGAMTHFSFHWGHLLVPQIKQTPPSSAGCIPAQAGQRPSCLVRPEQGVGQPGWGQEGLPTWRSFWVLGRPPRRVSRLHGHLSAGVAPLQPEKGLGPRQPGCGSFTRLGFFFFGPQQASPTGFCFYSFIY